MRAQLAPLAQRRGLAAQERQLAAQAARLASQVAALAAQGARLAAQAASLRAQGAALQRQAAALQRQGNELKRQQQQLQAQADKAKQLQDQLTKELTKAGGDPRGTDPRVVQPAGRPGFAARRVPGVAAGHQQGRRHDHPERHRHTRPADPKTAALVRQLRSSVIPGATGPGVAAYVGGSTASNVDLAALIAARLPVVIVTVLALSFALLLLATRSLLVPLQAAVTNLLSVAASFGVLTAVFQWGWGLSLIGLSNPYGTVPIASYVPLMMFAGLFGLSMDYEVFLVSQVDEHHRRGMAPREAVRRGVAGSARVIAAAGLIMISVFGSFIINGDPVIKQFGVGLAVAVLLAASMTLLLAPAVLVLLGRALWWLPGPVGGCCPTSAWTRGAAVTKHCRRCPRGSRWRSRPWSTKARRRPQTTRPGRRPEGGHRDRAVAAGRRRCYSHAAEPRRGSPVEGRARAPRSDAGAPKGQGAESAETLRQTERGGTGPRMTRRHRRPQTGWWSHRPVFFIGRRGCRLRHGGPFPGRGAGAGSRRTMAWDWRQRAWPTRAIHRS